MYSKYAKIKIIRSSKIIYKKLSYQIVGIMFDILKELGSSYHEKYYKRAIETYFRINKLLRS